MKQTKFLISSLLAVMLLATQIVAVDAAPAMQETTPITGKVVSISINTDTETDEVTVVVVIVDEADATQTISLSLEEARTLGFVIGDGNLSTDDSKIGEFITYPPVMLVSVVEEENEHPVGSAIANFFFGLLDVDVDYETIMTYHDDNGIGFGVIAQALWMTKALDGNTDTFKDILYAKENNDFDDITLPDGSKPKNWGQFRKAVMSDLEKSKANLGAIMSRRTIKDKDKEMQDGLKDNGKPVKDKGKPDKESKNNNGNGKNKNK